VELSLLLIMYQLNLTLNVLVKINNVAT